MDAYMLMHTQVGRAQEVATRVARLDAVVSAEVVSGAYDVVVRATGSCEHDLIGCLEEEMARIPGVVRVLGCPVASKERPWETGTEPAPVATAA